MNKTRLTLSRMAFIMSVSCAPLILSNCGSEKEKPEADKKDDKGDKGDKKGTEAEVKTAKEGETAAKAELTKVNTELTKLKALGEGAVEEKTKLEAEKTKLEAEKAKLDKEVKTLQATVTAEEKKVTAEAALKNKAEADKKQAEIDKTAAENAKSAETAKLTAATNKASALNDILSKFALTTNPVEVAKFIGEFNSHYDKGYVSVSGDKVITEAETCKAILAAIHGKLKDNKLPKGSLVVHTDTAVPTFLVYVTLEDILAVTVDTGKVGSADLTTGAGLDALQILDNKGVVNQAKVKLKI